MKTMERATLAWRTRKKGFGGIPAQFTDQEECIAQAADEQFRGMQEQLNAVKQRLSKLEGREAE